jgi:voltage-gated potassium channel
MPNLGKLRYLLLLPALVIIIGTFGFMALEKLSFLDALYFTVTTITTVGYGDISVTTVGGKIFAIIIILLGVSTVLAILSNILQWFIQRQQRTMHVHRRNMLIGVFFSEAGNRLLQMLASYDPDIPAIRQDFLVKPDWTPAEFHRLKTRLKSHPHSVEPSKVNLPALHEFLLSKGDMLIRQLENPDIIENESYAELLWAAVHLRDELSARPSLENLSRTDAGHLIVDTKRVYTLLTPVWIVYMQYLKGRYPFLFSLALRTNPFVENQDATVKE